MNNRNGRASRGLPGSIPSWLSKGRYCVSRVSHFESIETSHLAPEFGGTRGHRPHRLVDRRQCQPAARIARAWPSAARVSTSRWASSTRSKPLRGFRRARLSLKLASLRCPGPLRGGKLAPWWPAVGILPRGPHCCGSPNVPGSSSIPRRTCTGSSRRGSGRRV